MKNEIAKLGGINYELLESTALKILKEKSKDIRVLSFLSFSFLKSANWEYYCDIFDGLGTLIEKDYDAIYPDRPRAKQNAFKWLAEERYTTILAECKPAEEHYEHIVRLIAGLTKIKPILEEKFPEGSPFPSQIFSMAQRWEKSCKPKPKEEPPPPPPKEAEDAPSAPTAAATTAQPKPPAATSASTASVSTGPVENPKQAQAAVRKTALFLIENEPTKIMGYRLMRSVRWDVFEKAPPADGGKTQLPAPNPQQRAYFQKLMGDKEWKTLLEKGEAAFVSGANHVWLDLQRMICIACKELGAEYTSVRKAVLVETAILVNRVPDIVGLNFTDGSAFCDDATKDWISSEAQSALGSEEGAQSDGGGGGAGGDSLVKEQREVNQLVSSGKIEDALALVQANMRSSSNERDNFRRTVIVGSLLLKAKQPDIAISVLESLDQKIERHGLDKWDPDIAVDAWSNLVTAYKGGKNQKPPNVLAAITEKQNKILSKISQLDPKRAFILSK